MVVRVASAPTGSGMGLAVSRDGVIGSADCIGEGGQQQRCVSRVYQLGRSVTAAKLVAVSAGLRLLR